MFRKSGNRFSEKNMRNPKNLERIASGCALACMYDARLCSDPAAMGEKAPMNRPELPSSLRASEQAPARGRLGVLIVNLGTPDAADAPSVRRYLREFLSDPRVIE